MAFDICCLMFADVSCLKSLPAENVPPVTCNLPCVKQDPWYNSMRAQA